MTTEGEQQQRVIVDDPWSSGDACFLRCSVDLVGKWLCAELQSVDASCLTPVDCSTLCPLFFEVACHVARLMHETRGRDVIVCLASYSNRLFLVFDFQALSRPILLRHTPTFPVDATTYERLVHDVCMFTMTRAERLPSITLFYAYTYVVSSGASRSAIHAKRLLVPPFSQVGVEVPCVSTPGAAIYTRVHPVFECIVSPSNAIAIVEANGLVLRFVYVHAVYRGVYIRVHHDRVDTSGMEAMLREGPGLHGGSGSGPFHSVMPASPVPELLLSALTAPSLYPECRAALLELANSSDALALVDHPPDRMHPLAAAMFKKRGREMQQRMLSPADLAARLSTEAGTLQELNGVVYDVVLQQSSLAELPPEWNPGLFYTLLDTGFLTVLYMLQWRHSLERFVEMAKLAGAEFVVPLHCLDSFRVGILWQNRQAPLLQSLYRQLPCGSYLFVFNAGRDAFSVKPGGAQALSDFVVAGALQTQSAKQRDTVTSFFLTQALYLVSAVLTGGIGSERHAHVMSLLLGIYMSNLHAYDLRHDYKNNQASVRELRTLTPLTRRRR